jgi:DNA-binding beta-propeller fold protein YncE
MDLRRHATTIGTQGFANGGGYSAEYNYPFGVAIDNYGNAYITDFYSSCIRKIAPNNNIF